MNCLHWLSFSALLIYSTTTFAADMDHSQHGAMDHSQHSAMDHSQHSAMDHSQHGGMDHSQHGDMDHSQHSDLDHSQHSAMDHSQHGGMDHSRHQMPQDKTMAQLTGKISYYTCSMHPQIRSDDKDGRCPICGMSLVAVYEETSTDTARQLTLSESALKLAEIETTRVLRMFPEHQVRLFGQVAFDETRVADISAYFPGRIEKLYVNYEGIPVNEGDHLADIYSPELITAQQELREALMAVKHTRNASGYARTANEQNLKAVREKLRLWGLSPKQIQDMEKSDGLMERLTIYSPQKGIVIKQNVQEGQYLKTGDRIYRVASMDRLWVELEAYETQLPWLRYGQPVSFRTDARPGETFSGKISFISPTVNPNTRTVPVRVNIDNSNGSLKPGLFVRATVTSKIAGHGDVIDASLRGKWVGPMHPEIIRDHPGTCDICGMDLVPAESLGYFNESGVQAPLVIPASAPLITGKRAIVFVKVPNQDKPTFESREVILGPRADRVYLVQSGLHEGEEIVTQGAFKIDSAMQISAKPSMMNSDPGETPASNNPHQHH